MSEQLRLPFEQADATADTLVISSSNEAAARALHGWRAWPGGAFALCGPPRAGKSLMARAWAEKVNAVSLSPAADIDAARSAFATSGGRVVLDSVECGLDDDAVALLIDLARDASGALLLVGRGTPAHWPARTADLTSRLSALPVAAVGEPDMDLLVAVLRRHARARFLELPDAVARYVAAHIERSFAAADAVIAEIDTVIQRAHVPVSYDVARRAMNALQALSPEEESV